MNHISSLPLLCLLLSLCFGHFSMAQSHWTSRTYHQAPITLKDEKQPVLLPAGEHLHERYGTTKCIDGLALRSLSVEGRASVMASRKQMGLSRSYWGFTLKNGGDSIKVTLRQVLNDYGDFFDKRFTRVTTELNGMVLKTKDFTEEFTTESGRYNTLGLSYDFSTSMLAVLGGASPRESIMDIELPGWNLSNPQVEVWAVGEINFSSLSAESMYDPSRFLTSGWSIERLNEHFTISSDPLEGYWEYLDRKNDPRYGRLGGRYTLAVVKSPGESDDYHILYVDGAETLATQWKPLMIKGKLKGTAFQQHYDLTWFDSTFQPIDRDIHASMTDNAILTLYFPLLKTELRFSKRP